MQPSYVVLELLVAAGASAAYSIGDDTISSLGQVRCAPGGGLCSPWHLVLDTAFVVYGLLRALGALLLHRHLPRGGWRTASVVLWVASGLAAAAVGVVPVDLHPGLHGVVATPVFVLQPLAVLATALVLGRWPHPSRFLMRSGLVAGVLSLAGVVAFGARLGRPFGQGGLERLALWPAYVWLGVVAVGLSAGGSRRGAGTGDGTPRGRPG